MTSQQTANRTNADQRITVCKVCLFSILIGQPSVWLTKPMGLSHKACAANVWAPR